VDPVNKQKITLELGNSVLGKPIMIGNYQFLNGIPNFVDKDLLNEDELISLRWYEENFKDYDNYLPITFEILQCEEKTERRKMYVAINILGGNRVLEIGAGTGIDSIELIKNLSPGDFYYIQDINYDVLQIAVEKMDREKNDVNVVPFLSSANQLPFPDNYFDRIFHFGGVNNFGSNFSALTEMHRVLKVGGKILLGDESIPPWLRETDYFKILYDHNHYYGFMPPLKFIPKNSTNFKLEWFMGSAFYFMVYEKTKNQPQGNFDIPIPGTRGGTLNSRYYGKLEGVDPMLKQQFIEKVKALGLQQKNVLDKLLFEFINSQNQK
jgi:ubiquinone/menaquinone biosynthesis C-methylase UbiE